MPDRWMRKAVAEAIGAFALVFVGILVITSSSGGLTSIALAHGLTIAIFVAALAHVSGGHFNPAVTLAMYLSKAIDLRGALIYWASQLIGGLAAALVVLLATERSVVAAGTPVLDEGVGVGVAIVLEAVVTFMLVLVVYGTVVDPRAPYSAYPFAIGFAVTAGVFAIGPMTGAALNPARAFGPALVSGEWGAAGAWLIGPMLGAVLAWAAYEYVISPRSESVESAHGVAPAEPDQGVESAAPAEDVVPAENVPSRTMTPWDHLIPAPERVASAPKPKAPTGSPQPATAKADAARPMAKPASSSNGMPAETDAAGSNGMATAEADKSGEANKAGDADSDGEETSETEPESKTISVAARRENAAEAKAGTGK